MPGMPIVFIPGLLTTCRIFQHQIEHLGQSRPVLLANHWSAATMGEIAGQILSVAPDRFALVGTSMGGYVALEIMRHAPERVSKLALMNTSAKADTADRTRMRREQLAWTRKHGVRAGTKALWDLLVHPARHEDLALLTVFYEMAEELGIDAFTRQTEAIIGREDSRPTLADIAIPTLVVAGEDDVLIPPENSNEIAAGIEGATLQTVPHCGHMGMIERPLAYTKLLTDFLD